MWCAEATVAYRFPPLHSSKVHDCHSEQSGVCQCVWPSSQHEHRHRPDGELNSHSSERVSKSE